MNGTPGQKLKSKNPPVHGRWHKKERQVLVIPVFLGPSVYNGFDEHTMATGTYSIFKRNNNSFSHIRQARLLRLQ